MGTELNTKEQDLKKNPFKVPDGYMEGLTAQIMSQLPEKPVVEAKKVTLMDRVRPWAYMAAMFAGLGLFFKVLTGIGNSGNDSIDNSLLVQSTTPIENIYQVDTAEDEEYWEYLEAQYTNYLMAEELNDFE